MHNNLISGLVKPGDQALISISTILKVSALFKLLNPIKGTVSLIVRDPTCKGYPWNPNQIKVVW